MSHALAYEEPGSGASAALSLLVHAMLFAFLYFGVRWQSKHPDVVTVELWSQPAIESPQPAPVVEPKPEIKPEPAPPRVEPAPKKPDIALEREKQKPLRKEEPKREQPLKFDATQRIREQLAQEQRAFSRTRERPAESPSPAASAIDAGYADRIRSKIKSNIVLPPGIPGNPEAIFDVVQLPTGEVIDVKLRKSSGHSAYDDAVERAIRKGSPLPRPERAEQFRRDLQLRFRPQD